MDLKEEILKEHSRKQAVKIAGWVGNDKKRFSRLADIFVNGDAVSSQRSAYPVSIIAEKYPELIVSNLDSFLKKLNEGKIHNALKRCIMRSLQGAVIPEKYQAQVLNKCFEYIPDPEEPVAVRCFAMTVLVNMVKLYPEIKNEAEDVIRAGMKISSAGLKVRSREVLKELEKISVVD